MCVCIYRNSVVYNETLKNKFQAKSTYLVKIIVKTLIESMSNENSEPNSLPTRFWANFATLNIFQPRLLGPVTRKKC